MYVGGISAVGGLTSVSVVAAATGVGAIFAAVVGGVYLLYKSQKWNREEIIAKTEKYVFDQLDSNKAQFIKKAMEAWDEATKDAIKIVEGRAEVLGGEKIYDDFL